jgi:hypothetical protein
MEKQMKFRFKTIATLVLAAFALLAPGAKAQTMAGMNHTAPTPGVANLPAGTVIGSASPEQIPDIVAFRLWLTGFDITKPISTQIQPYIGLSVSDTDILQQTVQTYLLSHASIINDYNASATTNTADVSQFWASTYNLARNTLAGLQINLSPVGVTQFTAFLQGEKHNMTVGPYDQGLGEVAKRNLAERNMVAGQIMFGTQTTANYSSYSSASPVFPALDNITGFTNPTGNWTTLAGSFSFTNGVAHVVSNGTGADNEAYAHWHYPTTGDQLVSVQLATLPQSGKDSGITVRSASTGETFFDAKFYSYNGQGYILIDQMNSGTDTFQQAYAYTQAVNDTLEIDIVGNYYTVLINGAYINTFSASSIHSGVPGITGIVGGGDLKNLEIRSGYGLGVSVSVTGTTTCTGAACPPTSVKHTGSVTIKGGTQGGTYTGNSVAYNAYLSASGYVVFVAPIPVGNSTFGPIDIEAHIQCSAIGSFWNAVILYESNPMPWKLKMIWGTQTFGDTKSWAPDGLGGYKITTQLNCTPESTPPDVIPVGSYNLVYKHAPYPSWWIPGLCEDIYGNLKVCTVIPPGFAGFNTDITMAPNSGLCTAKHGSVNPVWSMDY